MLFGFFVVWFVMSIFIGAHAREKGQAGFDYFLMSFFLSPLFGLIAVALAKDLKTEARKEAEKRADHEARLAEIKALAPQQQAPAARNVTDELLRLADLHKSGALTQDEFNAAKTKLIA